MTEEERMKAVEQAKKYVEKNPNRDPKLYHPEGKGKTGSKGKPGEATDCSGLTSNCLVTAGVKDPISTGTGGGIKRTVNNTEKVKNNWVQEGNIVTFNNGKTGKDAKSNTHGGIVTKVNINESGQVTSVKFIHSASSTGPIESTVNLDGTGYYGKRFEGFRKWDSPEPKAPPIFTVEP